MDIYQGHSVLLGVRMVVFRADSLTCLPWMNSKVKMKLFLFSHHSLFACSDTQYYPIKYIYLVGSLKLPIIYF